MSADAVLARWTAPPRRRGIADDVLGALPLPLVIAAAAWRWQSALVGGIALLVAVVIVGVAAFRARRFDRRWLIGQLDARRPDVEDSADLLFAIELNPLQRLQRARLEARLADVTDLRPAWSTRRIAAAWLTGLVGVALILLWPDGRAPSTALAPSAEGLPAVLGVPRLVGQRLRIVPPAYTGLPAYDAAGLDARAPQGSRLQWTLHFEPQPDAAVLLFYDRASGMLVRSGGDWTVGRTLDRSTLYRVVPRGGASPAPPLHRLDAVADTPPRIKVVAPDRSLTLVTPGEHRWALAFDVDDDYGVAPSAQLRITLAEGEGENVSFREQLVVVRGSGSTRRKRFAAQLDLAALGFKAGGDLVAQLVVGDNRAPRPQVVRSPSLILRWPSDLGQEATGLDAMAKKILPAYFRSQRQIIIDAEALLKQRRALDAARFVSRSDGIGTDQRILRLRYGQFLGEEAEGGPKPPPTNDAPTTAPVGNAGDVTAEYGHVHDEAEAATLLDPDTRATLKQALDQMWQSELHLRQGDPRQALPYAYKALWLIKQVQQATRIFLARVGPELPPIDATRRMTGKRDGLERRAIELAPRPDLDAAPAAAWQALAGGVAVPLDGLEAWLRANAGRVADPLSLTAAIDAVRQDPACSECRRTLRARLWGAMPRPATGVVRRGAGDNAGRRYLDALGDR